MLSNSLRLSPQAVLITAMWLCCFARDGRAAVGPILLCPAFHSAVEKSVQVVFVGDSITRRWFRLSPSMFSANDLNAGSSGQTTSQILLHFCVDVVYHHPQIVHILAGINDLAGNGGFVSLSLVEQNIALMAETARYSGAEVILGSVLPARRVPWHPTVDPSHRIVELDAWIKGYAGTHHFLFANYYQALSDGKGGLRALTSSDGVHPTQYGYSLMNPIARASVEEAMRQLQDGGSLSPRQ